MSQSDEDIAHLRQHWAKLAMGMHHEGARRGWARMGEARQGMAQHTAMGQAGPDYHDLTFTHSVAPPEDVEDDDDYDRQWEHHRFDAHHDGENVGHITIEHHPSEDHSGIWGLQVHPDHRRRGVARQLLDHARTHPGLGEIRHSDFLTDEGRGWADSVGGPRIAMGQAGPDYDNLTFHQMSAETYGAHPDIHHHQMLFAKHPDHGYVGHIQFEQHPDHVEIHNLSVWPDHQRRGVASQLMGELERRHPDTTIDHGVRTGHGRDWAESYYGPAATADPRPGEMGKARRTRDRQLVAARHTAAEREPLPIAKGKTFYRAHPVSRAFGPEHAVSHPLDQPEHAQRGYSSFDNPHDLERYLHAQGWVYGDSELPIKVDSPDWKIIHYQGRKVGTGVDHEHLSVPASTEHHAMDYGDFFGRLLRTPHPNVRQHWHGADVAEHQGWGKGNGSKCNEDPYWGECGHEAGHEASRHTAADEQQTEHVLAEDVPHQGDHPSAPSDDDHPSFFAPGKRFSFRHVPLDKVLGHEQRCPGGRHGAHCYTGDKWEHPHHAHDTDRPYFEDEATPEQIAKGPKGHWTDERGEAHPYYRDDADNVARMAEHPHELPALVIHGGGMNGGGHRTAAWREAGMTHVPAWVHDDELADWDSAGARKQASRHTAADWHSHQDVSEANDDFEGRFGSAPDTHELVAEHLGVPPNEVHYRLEHHPASAFPHRGAHNFDTDDERAYVHEMAKHTQDLAPLVAAGVPNGREPVSVVDGHHRLGAHAEAGSAQVPIFVGYPRSQHTAADWHEYRRIQDSQQRRYERPGIAGSAEDKDRYFGTGEMMGHGVERQITPKDWIQHSRGQQLHEVEPEFQEHWRGYQMGHAHGQKGRVDTEELDREYGRSPHPEHFSEGYADGLEHAMEPQERIAVLVSGKATAPVFVSLMKVAHVSGNTIDALHCPFCGSGSVTARSDGSIECGFCTAAYTVQVQPQFSAFPQSVDGAQYPWPGRDDMGMGAGGAPVPPGGGGMAVPGGDEGDGDGDAPPWAQDGDEGDDEASGPPGADDGDDEDEDDEASVGGSKAPPFGKKSYRNARGAVLSGEDYLRHLAILSSADPARTAAFIKAERQGASV